MCKDVKCMMNAEKFNQDITLNLRDRGNGKGVRHLTIRNTGDCNLIIADMALETLAPGAVFAVNSPYPILNESLPLRFEAGGARPEAIIRYLVEIPGGCN